ncbi:2,3-dihydroxybenzoate decarboxylase [Madurella mycetomatis]|uniref:2,3-dihydroxybenzoate decarboxylase n=1 Tax=Madurella mycetomatis TaxID=100816 RepID=A0A175WHT7_9PEZI|nr:2,3-dihydroxybenzoate decarboxylase [Madurella mycetomatis]
MLGKIALEEAWATPESLASSGLVTSLAPKGVIGPDLVASLLDVHGTRLRQMDDNGVDMMVLSLSSPGAQGVADPVAAAALARSANDKLAEEVSRDPKRFAGLVSVSMHGAGEAARELRRCVEEKDGFVGVMVNDYQSVERGEGKGVGGMRFYDAGQEYDEFWGAAEELEMPVYLHPREATQEVFELMWKDRPWLAYSALGYAHRVGMHVLGIVTSGVLDRFPGLKLVIGHMGEHIPYDLYRIDHKLNRARFPNMPMAKDKLVRDYFGSQLFITTSGHFSTPALLCAMQEIGAESIMFSIDYPFESIPNGCVWFDEHVQISNRDLVDIGRNNALRVFKRLKEGRHGLGEKGPRECGVGGLGLKEGAEGEVEYGLYNRSWDQRLERH